MQENDIERTIASLTDFERAALIQKDGWAILPTRIFGTEPHEIPPLWAKGLVEVYWSPRAIELRSYMIKKRKEERGVY